MKKSSYAVISIKFTFLSILFFIIEYLFLYHFNFFDRNEKLIDGAIYIFGSIPTFYFALKLVLSPTIRKKKLFLIRNNTIYNNFSGIPSVAMAWAVIWRLYIIQVPINALSSLMKNMHGQFLTVQQSTVIDIVSALFAIFISCYWSLKHQFGKTKISEHIEIDTTEIVIDGQDIAVLNFRSLLSGIAGTLSTIAVVSYFILGLVQMAAVYSFFRDYWHWWFIPSLLVSGFVSYIPVVGSVAGVIAAYKVWHWSLIYSIALFFFPIFLYIPAGIILGFGALFINTFKRSNVK